ncbi:hypothetical protein WN943_014452 [Citrus x changshan-huyou]
MSDEIKKLTIDEPFNTPPKGSAGHVVFYESKFPFSTDPQFSKQSSTSVSEYRHPMFKTSFVLVLLHDPSGSSDNIVQQLQLHAVPASSSSSSSSSSSPLPPNPYFPDPYHNMSHNSQHSSSSTSIVPIPQPYVPAHVPLPTHPMVTRAKAGIFKPKFLAYSSVLEEHEPATISQALSNPKWKAAMQAEYDALMKNETWVLVPASQATKVVGCKWVFRIKYNADGSISEYKARLVANGFHQTPGIDYFETFSPVVKQSTMRIVLSLAVMKNWKIRQIDINNAFLNGQLNEDAPRAWFDRLRKALLKWGFQNSRTDSSLFFKHELGGIVVVLVYVDEILITVDNNTVIERFIKYLGDTFALKDLGEFNYFLGIEVTQGTEDNLHLSQAKYVRDLLTKTAEKYLVLTRPELAFSVNKLSQFLAASTEKHWTVCKRILRYLKATEDYGLLFKPGGGVVLTAYTDADWACDVDDRKSVGAYCVYLGQNLISWSSEKQQTIARSST